MSDRKQITVRNVKCLSYERLQEVRETSRIPLGLLLDEAIELWWHQLPEEQEEEQTDN